MRRRIADRPVHLVLENDANEARRLRRQVGRPVGYTAQWNDDLHHVLHVLATGRTGGYYGDYAEEPIALLGRALASGFVYQGEPSPYRGGEARGEPSGHLPPTAFVSFLQNHDQIGNTPFGERIAADAPDALVHAAVAIVLLSPQIPLLFMGEEWATARPFMFFCDFEPDLAAAVREGRQREFAQFAEFGEAAAQGRIPDATEEGSFRCVPPGLVRARARAAPDLARALSPDVAGAAGRDRAASRRHRAGRRVPVGSGRRRCARNGRSATARCCCCSPISAMRRCRSAIGASGATLLYCTVAEPPGDEIAPSCAAFYLIPPGERRRDEPARCPAPRRRSARHRDQSCRCVRRQARGQRRNAVPADRGVRPARRPATGRRGARRGTERGAVRARPGPHRGPGRPRPGAASAPAAGELRGAASNGISGSKTAASRPAAATATRCACRADCRSGYHRLAVAAGRHAAPRST